MMKKFLALLSAMAACAAITPASVSAYDTLTDEQTEQIGYVYECSYDKRLNAEEDIKGAIKVYNTGLYFSFLYNEDIDQFLNSRELMQVYYAVDFTDGTTLFFNDRFDEMKMEPIMKERAKEVYNDATFVQTYIDENAETEGVYYLSGESSMMGTAVYFKTSVGDYVYYDHYAFGEKIMPLKVFRDLEKCIQKYYEETDPNGEMGGGITDRDVFCLDMYDLKKVRSDILGDANGDREFNIADLVVVERWLLSADDASLDNWRLVDLCEDGVIDVFDLCAMKIELVKQFGNFIDPPETTFSPSFNADEIERISVHGEKSGKFTGYIEYFTPEKIGAVVDYLNGLHLKEGIPDGVNPYIGDSWDISLFVKDSDPIFVEMNQYLFYRCGNTEFCSMDYNEAAVFDELIEKYPTDYVEPDYSDEVVICVPPSKFRKECINEKERIYDHGSVITKVYEVSIAETAQFEVSVMDMKGVEVIGEPKVERNGSIATVSISFVVEDDAVPGSLTFRMNLGDGFLWADEVIHCWTENGRDYVSTLCLEVLQDLCDGIDAYFYGR